MNSRFKKSKRIRKKQSFFNKLDKPLAIKTLVTLTLLVILILLFSYTLSVISTRITFEKDIANFHELNSEKIFSIDNITLYHSASAKPNTEIKKSFVLDIYQFTDISFNIKNEKNTIIKEFYLDNITSTLTTDINNIGFVYKNPLEFGYLNNFDVKISERIDFKVLDSNNNTDFSQAYVYNNLSNPITLEYVNSKVVENFNTSIRNMSIEYNGKLLKEADVDLNNISGNIYFNINIIDTNDNLYTCRVRIPINLTNSNSAIYNGELLETINTRKFIFIF